MMIDPLSRGMKESIKYERYMDCIHCGKRKIWNVKHGLCSRCFHIDMVHLSWIKRFNIRTRRWLVNYGFDILYNIDDDELLNIIGEHTFECNRCDMCSEWESDIEWI